MISPYRNEYTANDTIIQGKTAWFRTGRKFVMCVSGLFLKQPFLGCKYNNAWGVEKVEIASLAQGVQMTGCP